jgi:hypothetical protein
MSIRGYLVIFGKFHHAGKNAKSLKNDIKKHNLGLKYGNRLNFAFLVIICIFCGLITCSTLLRNFCIFTI